MIHSTLAGSHGHLARTTATNTNPEEVAHDLPDRTGRPTATGWRGDNGEHPSRTTGHHDTRPPREGHRERLTAAVPAAAEPVHSRADGSGAAPMIRSGSPVHQTSHDPLCQMLRTVLVDGVRAGRGAAGGIGSLECRAVLTLYSLLSDHPVDRWSRCRSCRRPGSVLGARWRPCQVHNTATLCLRQLDEVAAIAAAPPGLTARSTAGLDVPRTGV
jgi:hypothetical protein